MSPEFSVRRTSASPAIWPILAWRWQCVIDLDDLTEKYETVSSPKVLPFFPSLSHHSSNLSFFAVGLLIVFYALLISLKKKIFLPSSLISCIVVLDFYRISVPFQCFGIKVCLLLYKGEWCYLTGGAKLGKTIRHFRNSLRGRRTKVRGRQKSAKTGKGESIPLPFSLPPYPLALSISVTQDALETKLSSFELKITAEYKH